jgi:uncharacterized phage protein gp47/JayE
MYQPEPVSTILRDLRNSVKAEVTDSKPWAFPNTLVPSLKALAQAFRAVYLRIQFIHEQAFVITARDEYLDYHGVQNGGLSRDPATYAQGVVDIAGTPGTVVDDGSILNRSDGQQYVTVGSLTIITSPLRAQVRATESGAIPNTDPGATFTFVTPITGVTSVTVEDPGIIGGFDAESYESFRQRILYYKQNPPGGGKASEYQEWCQTKVGVTRVFPMRATPQPGSVTVYFMMDGVGTGIPTADDVAELQGLLDQLAPEHVEVIVLAPVSQTLDITITGLVPNTAVVRNRIVDEIKSAFLRKSEPASVTTPFVFSKAWITEAIASTPGWVKSNVTIPAGDTTVSTAGHILQLGTISFA